MGMRARWRWGAMAVLILAISAMLGGCTTPQDRGDRAFELGHYPEASEHYEQAIADGSRDPEIYYRAAQSAQRQGAFANAERYFSQALRYGGGVEVARSLAEFYVQTSNFSQAVKVLQYLLHIADDVQPVYADIGTALMYAGHYMDAEQYLTLAQQMNPSATAPYINLGVLYDNHIRNHPRAVSFYRCYLEMTDEGQHRRMVETRLREIEAQRRVDTSRVGLDCGEAFRPRPLEDDDFDLSQVIELGDEREGEREGEVEPLVIERLRLDIPLDYDTRSLDSVEVAEEVPASDGESDAPVRLGIDPEQAHRAYEDGRYDEVLELLDDGEEGQTLGAEERELMGRAAYRVGEFEQAAQAMEQVVEQRPSPERVDILISIYEAKEDEDGKSSLCDRFERWPDYRDVMRRCED